MCDSSQDGSSQLTSTCSTFSDSESATITLGRFCQIDP